MLALQVLCEGGERLGVVVHYVEMLGACSFELSADVFVLGESKTGAHLL